MFFFGYGSPKYGKINENTIEKFVDFSELYFVHPFKLTQMDKIQKKKYCQQIIQVN